LRDARTLEPRIRKRYNRVLAFLPALKWQLL